MNAKSNKVIEICQVFLFPNFREIKDQKGIEAKLLKPLSPRTKP